MQKKCISCGGIFDLSDFYVHSKMKDGHLNICKECVKERSRQRIRGPREITEKIREYDRNRKNAKERTLKCKEYAKKRKQEDPVLYNKIRSDTNKRYRQKCKEKERAHGAVFYAISTGKMNNPCVCEKCLSKGYTEAHHYDYSKPLEVTWLCDKCHKEVHKEMRRMIRQNK